MRWIAPLLLTVALAGCLGGGEETDSLTAGTPAVGGDADAAVERAACACAFASYTNPEAVGGDWTFTVTPFAAAHVDYALVVHSA